jgi:hypothetical protein
MKVLLLAFFCILIFKIPSWGQKPGDLLTSWSDKSPIEKVYLHVDRDNYLAGETIWFKAYLYSDFYPDTISTILFVELVNSNAVTISKKILPVTYGNTKGQVELPDSILSGYYYIRAYSPTMLNQDAGFLYNRRIYITGRNVTVQDNTPAEKRTRVEFFPESGSFVGGVPNSVAFKITDENGLPLNLSGVLKNETGDSITEFSSYHDGMGSIDLLPAKDEKYYVQLNDDPFAVKYYLPEVSATGIVFRLMPNTVGRYFEVYQRTGNPLLKADYMIGQMQHRVIFRMDLDRTKNDITGLINTQKTNSGILQVTIFNKDGLPLAERLCFVDNKEYRQPAELIIDTVNFSDRMRNHYTLSFPDTVGGSFSVAITDPDYDAETHRSETIISNLLLTSDLKGYIHNPAYYFSTDNDSAANAMDLLMMVNGWRRFKWSELSNLAAATPRYKDPGYITITGKVNIRDTKKPLVNKELLVLVFPVEDSLNRSITFMETDGEGKFRMDSLVFAGKTTLLVSDIIGRKNKWLDMYPDSDSINSAYPVPAVDEKRFSHRTGIPDSLSDRLAFEYAGIRNAAGKLLKGVTLKVKKKTPVQELEERYASGLFSGLSEKTIDLVNTNEKIFQSNIFDYIQGRIAGIKVVRNGFGYNLYYRNRFSLFGDPIPMMLYLDEMQTDSRLISTIPANQVSMIKVYSSFVGAEGNGAGGVLAIYTKKGADFTSAYSTSADLFQYKGFSITKEFYSPDYSVRVKTDSVSSQKDHRTTLHWQPDIFVDGADMKIPLVFYNNDRSRSFKIIVEGMTAEGRMVFIEKIISPAVRPF